MNLVAQVFVLVAVLFGVMAFILESFLFHRVDVQTFLLGRPEPAEGVRLWAFNAAGPAAGLIAHYAGYAAVGRALVIYACAFMVGCGIVLFNSNRKLWRSMIGQSEAPEAPVAHE